MPIRAAILAATCLTPCLALGLPAGGVVTGGSASIGAPSGGQLSIGQRSNRATIDWNSFDIGQGERVEIRQPSASSILLNRIHDQKPSQIYGALTANGQVILANPNGMVFGPSSRVDVAGLIATASSVDRVAFQNDGKLAGTPGRVDAAVIHHGAITAKDGGLVALVAPEVRNDGLIIAKAGRVQLASGDTVAYDLYGDGLVSVAASPQQQKALVEQAGSIIAAGGTIALSAPQAAQLVDSAVNLSGVIEATSLAGQGGTITATAGTVTLAATARLHADGASGGGAVHLGGGYQGSGPLPWAKTVTVGAGAVLTASGSTRNAPGGEAVLWSSQRTHLAGRIEAKGHGAGAGGRIETSSKYDLGVADSASVSAASERGAAGSWLLDPGNITIAGAGGESNVDATGAPAAYGATAGTDAVIRDTTISTALNGGSNVIVQTSGADTNITTSGNPGITYTGSGTESLTLKASGSIALTNTTTIQSTGSGKLNTIVWSDSDNTNGGSVRVLNTTITTNGGRFVAGGGVDDGSNGGVIADGIPDGNAKGTAANASGVTISSSSISAGTGSISLRGSAYNNAAAGNLTGVALNNAQLTSSTGSIALTGTGGSGTTYNFGVGLTLSQITTSDGAITLAGLSQGSSTNNQGINLNASQITSNGITKGGSITLNGTGANGSGSDHGVALQGNSIITSINGDIGLTGTGGTSGSYNDGLYIAGARIISTGTGSNAAAITLSGTGGNATSNNYGIYFNGNGTSGGNAITTVDGTVSLTGLGRGNGSTDYGIDFDNASSIASTGSGTIALSGTGSSASTGNNYGIYLNGNSCVGGVNCTQISTINAGVTLNGLGRGSGNYNQGIHVDNAARIDSTGLGTISLVGTGTTGVSQNTGIELSASTISTNNGALSLAGIGGAMATGDTNRGLSLIGGTMIQSTGTATVTMNGTGGTGGNATAGIYVGGASTKITTGAGNIDLNGSGGAAALGFGGNGNNGVMIDTGTLISSNGLAGAAGTIRLTGTQGGTGFGSGITINNARVTSDYGDIMLRGIGGGDTLQQSESGIALTTGAQILSTGTGAGAAAISLSGTGGIGTSYNYGVYLGGNSCVGGVNCTQIGTVDGAITLIGLGKGTVLSDHGIVADASSRIVSTGLGTITLNGTGSATGTGNYNAGMYLSSNAFITSASGAISLIGSGGAGTGGANGVWLQSGAQIASTGTGPSAASITLNGTAGAGTTSNNGVYLNGNSCVGGTGCTAISTVDGAVSLTGRGKGSTDRNNGILVDLASRIVSTGTGGIGLNGTGSATGAGNYNSGVWLSGSNTLVTSPTGAIRLTGAGGGTGTYARGVWLQSGAQVTSTGSGTSAAAITFSGTGAAGASNNNYGVYLNGNACVGGVNCTAVTSVDGTIAMTGIGTGTSGTNQGLRLDSASRIDSTHAATITLNGTGGGGGAGSNNNGISLNGNISTTDGDLQLNALGGGGGGTGTGNAGIEVLAANSLLATGNGGITINTTGGNSSGTENRGITFGGGTIVTNQGDIVIHATGGTGGASAHAFINDNSGGVKTTGAGNIVITGQRVGVSGCDICALETNAIQTTGSGSITLSALGANGVTLANPTAVSTSAGAITLFSNSLSLSAGNLVSGGSLIIAPYSNISLGIGTAAGGTLNLTDARLGMLSANAYTFGAITNGNGTANTAGLSVNTGYSFTRNANFISGGSVTFAGALSGTQAINGTAVGPLTINGSISAGSSVLQTTNAASDITIGAAGSVSGSAPGSAVILAAGRNLINSNPSAATLSAPAGRWITYSGAPSTDVNGGLSASFQTFGCSYGGCVPAAGIGSGKFYRLALGGGGMPPPLPPLAPPLAPTSPPVPPISVPSVGAAPVTFSLPVFSLDRATLSQTVLAPIQPSSLALVLPLSDNNELGNEASQNSPGTNSRSPDAASSGPRHPATEQVDDATFISGTGPNADRSQQELFSFTPELQRLLGLP